MPGGNFENRGNTGSSKDSVPERSDSGGDAIPIPDGTDVTAKELSTGNLSASVMTAAAMPGIPGQGNMTPPQGQSPFATETSTTGDNSADTGSGQPQMPSGMQLPEGADSLTLQNYDTLILLGTSILVLAIGLIVVFTFKRRR